MTHIQCQRLNLKYAGVTVHVYIKGVTTNRLSYIKPTPTIVSKSECQIEYKDHHDNTISIQQNSDNQGLLSFLFSAISYVL